MKFRRMSVLAGLVVLLIALFSSGFVTSALTGSMAGPQVKATSTPPPFPDAYKLPSGDPSANVPGVITSSPDGIGHPCSSIAQEPQFMGVSPLAIAYPRQTCQSTGQMGDVATWQNNGHDYVGTSGFGGRMFFIYNVDDPYNPVLLKEESFPTGGTASLSIFDWKQGGNQYMSVTMRGSGTGCGWFAYNVNDPVNPVQVASVRNSPDWCTVHEHFVSLDSNGDADYAWFTMSGEAASEDKIVAMDIRNLSNIVEVNRYERPDGASFIHDSNVVRGKLYVAHWTGGLQIFDKAAFVAGGTPTPLNPIDSIRPSSFMIHHTVPTSDDRFVLVQDEFINSTSLGKEKLYDIQNLSSPSFVADIIGGDPAANGSQAHNMIIKPLSSGVDLLMTAWYRAGIRGFVINTNQSPPTITQVFRHQAATSAGAGFGNVWGVDWLPCTVRGLARTCLYAGDMTAGLVVNAVNTDNFQSDPSLDPYAPYVPVITSPTEGQEISTCSFTITGTAQQDYWSGLDRVEVSVDGGNTWHEATGTTNWSYEWNITSGGPHVIKARAIDMAENIAVSLDRNVNVTASCGGPTPTSAPPTNTPGVPTATPTCAPSAGGWSAGQSLPVPNVRAFGAYFPTNARFYAMGGRSSDTAGNAQLNPLEYNPATNTWITKTAVFSDQQTSNVQGGVVTMGGTPVIIVVGGSAGGGTGGTTETRVYNPVADTLVTLTTDPWTPGTTTVPGGSAVVANKLYIFGGFVINTAMSTEIWEFDPNAAAGSRWTLKGASLPAGRGYIPTVAIGSMIYMAGGSDWDGTTIFDSDQSVSYNPSTDTIGTIATIPRLTAETRAVNMAGKMWVLGGGRDAPNPNNQVDIYDPVANTWSVGTPFVTARRNFPTDTDGAGKIYLAGGYAPTAPDMSMEIFSSGTPCPTATPGGPTNTPVPPTATNTSGPGATNTPTTEPTSGATETPEATATVTACTLEFTDVPPGHTFYEFIRCLACQGIINGYPCGGDGEPCDPNNNPYFRPGNNITRGQLTKIVAISAGYSDPVSGQTFEDVLPGTAFYTYTEQLAGDGVMGGYPCGQLEGEPCVPPDNRPYFRPGNNATRGQLTKIVALAAGFNDPAPSTFTFTDVPEGHTFHIYVEALLLNRPGAISGYPCGGPGEPCDSENRNYFRPNNTLTRGQASKIVANTFFPGCNPPLDANPAESYLFR